MRKMKKIKNIDGKNLRSIVAWALIFVLIAFFLRGMSTVKPETELTYSAFKQYLKENRIKEVKVRTDVIRGTYTDQQGKEQLFKAVPVTDPGLIEELEKAGVKYSGESDKSWFTTILVNFGPVLLFLLIWFIMIRQMQSGGKQAMAFARSKAKLQNSNKDKITFSDVAGCDEAKEELVEIVEFLRDPRKFQKLGGKIPKGVILYGAPGTGKTLLAKAVAGEAGVPFFSSSGSEFVEMFVGIGASRVRDLFEQGRKNAPCLLFIDEIDAVGRHRFAGIGGGHDEREQTLNQLLVEMDGFDTKEGVILIAATNRPDVLDPALLRPGRFDRHIVVPIPDLKGREGILKVHVKNVKLSPSVDLNIIARRTPGFTGADIANLVNEAALLAARRGKEAVEMPEFEEAVERVIAGPERKSRMISEREKKIVAFHESGHTLVAKFLPDSDPIHKVSIMSRGPALGYTLQLPLEDKYLTTKSEILSRLTVLLGGRLAEMQEFNEMTTGAQNDLVKVAEIATRMVCEYGMSDKLGPMNFRKKEEEMFLGRDIMAREKMYSEKTAQIIDEEVKRIVDECVSKAQKILKEHADKLKALAEALVEKEVLDGLEVDRILGIEQPASAEAQA